MTPLEDRVRAGFARQSLMTTFGARLLNVTDSAVTRSTPLTDAAAGYATLTQMPEGREVMTVEPS